MSNRQQRRANTPFDYEKNKYFVANQIQNILINCLFMFKYLLSCNTKNNFKSILFISLVENIQIYKYFIDILQIHQAQYYGWVPNKQPFEQSKYLLDGSPLSLTKSKIN